MSISDFIDAFESGDFDLNDRKAMGSTLFCCVCMDQGHKTSKCH